MALLSPKLFYPSKLQENSLNLPEYWKISAPSKNSLHWSLILSYVISSEKSGLWEKGFELLLGSDTEIEDIMNKRKIHRSKPDRGKVKNYVLNFNPFRSRNSIYFNENMTDVLRIFKLRLNRYANRIKTNDSLKLEAVSQMLECQIVMITENSDTPKVYPHGSHPNKGRPQIVIFQQNNVQKGQRMFDAVFAFGISLVHSNPLRRDAMKHILKKASVNSDEILKIQRNFQYDSNFLLFLLTSEWKRIVPLIYKSPYIAWKLADAGFNTDPCCLGQNGISVFLHCMGFKSTRILQTLYNYAVNNFQQSDESIRNPSNVILECLKKVGRSIKNDSVNSDSFSCLGERKEAASKTTREILLLNEFQSCVIEELCGILQNSEHVNIKRKQIVISVLDNYLKYSNHQLPSTFDNHVKFSTYFENLDNYTCLMFFDKVLSLNPVTVSDNFLNTVLNLFLTVISYKVFLKCKHGAHCSRCQLSTDHCALRFISFNHRKKFEDCGKLYIAELQNTTDSSLTDSNKMLENIRLSLKDSPEITDEFLIKRLQRYLKTAKNVSLDDDDYLKGVLVIERAMQVIGETLHTTPGSKSVIGHLLNACLSNDIVHELFIIRNQLLSHYRPNIMQGRINLENDKIRFKSLQSILATLDDMLEPVYISQEFRVEEFLISINERESQRISSNIFQNIRAERNVIELLRKDRYLEHKYKYKLLSNNVLNYLQRLIDSNKFKKANELRGALEAVKFLFSFIAKQCNINNSQDIKKYVQELDSLIATEDEIKNKLKDDIIKNISNQICVLSTIFKDTKPDTVLSLSNLSELHKYFEDVKNFQWFTDQEISTIQREVLVYLKESNNTKEVLMVRIKNNLPTIDEVKELTKKIFTSAKNKEVIITSFQTNPNNALKPLRAIKNIDDNNIFKNVAAFTVFSEKEEGRNLLLNIKLPENLRKKLFRFLNRHIECLLNRIRHIKKILIEEDDEIDLLWKWGRSNEIKKHTRFLMGQRYMKEMDIRASLEMLLFDCMNIVIDRKDLEQLWTKTTNLFSGVCLRDVLSHGSTILETVGGLLDPEDLPSQFINKVLELIEDSEALQALSDLWQKKNPENLEQLKDSINAGKDKKKSLEERIVKCEKWEAYLPILPFK